MNINYLLIYSSLDEDLQKDKFHIQNFLFLKSNESKFAYAKYIIDNMGYHLSYLNNI